MPPPPPVSRCPRRGPLLYLVMLFCLGLVCLPLPPPVVVVLEEIYEMVCPPISFVGTCILCLYLRASCMCEVRTSSCCSFGVPKFFLFFLVSVLGLYTERPRGHTQATRGVTRCPAALNGLVVKVFVGTCCGVESNVEVEGTPSPKCHCGGTYLHRYRNHAGSHHRP